jgi:hypothetical protein
LAGENDIDHALLDGFCETHGFVGWFATSAKENKNIEEANKALVAAVLKHPDIFTKKAEPRRNTVRPTAASFSASRRNENGSSSWCCSSF